MQVFKKKKFRKQKLKPTHKCVGNTNYCSIWPPHIGTNVHDFLLQRSFQPPTPFPPASALLTKKTALWPCDLGVAVELREVEEQGCVVGGTVWPVVRREARVLQLWVQ